MIRQIKKWILRFTVTTLFISGLLLVIILNPNLTYAHKTNYKTYSIFHDQPLDKNLPLYLNETTKLLKTSTFYDPEFQLDICLNNGSTYPQLMQVIRGQAFGWGFYNKVVLQGTANYSRNYIELNGYKWNLTQLLAHEITHCLQFRKLGIWKSKPFANIPDWKWEGYAEYVSRQNPGQKDLSGNITRLLKSDKNSWEINFADSTIAPRTYYENWILVQFYIDVKKMGYQQILTDTTGEQTIRQEMMTWYNRNRKPEDSTSAK